MANNMFLKLKDITGESLDLDHPNEIEIHNWSWGLDNNASFRLRDEKSATPQTTVAPLTIDKMLDNATVPLVQYCAQGTHIAEGELVCRKNTGDKYGSEEHHKKHQDEFWKIKLKDIKVLSVRWPGVAEEHRIPETVELSFLSFTVFYQMQTQEGNLTGARHFPFDIPEQKVAQQGSSAGGGQGGGGQGGGGGGQGGAGGGQSSSRPR
jgi:type VI secretion system secreted protein Hcp